MFKWDRLLRMKKEKSIYLKNLDEDLHDFDWQKELADKADQKDKNGEENEIVEIEILPAKIICPDCGGITLEGLDFCDKCGGEL
ncbi:hypothetical protein DFR55_11821 [Herbinix hemicellulosilytica]|uniref:Zinc ribbon domain-containing protein n=1 Tax=Herbinix hemicellulosilytica TaxID=1564487 RepID=A0A0H5SER7_HERHM|nr:hypothetical protein [Herbinix hemicellulosilytica]RBP57816.1 hypothetical protein DFR55_11821 [Herbinix hemicellulosilytica]CRZ33351.1 hypothetical protein HHT355_0137 [Herbinix hemicellulosilytica]